MKMEVKLRVLTLNCWGIPGLSADRKDRMMAIANELSTGLYDCVVLQEVWSHDDYLNISRKTSSVLPYSYYFHSGMIGSGLCVLSKGKITNTLYHAWPLNGYIHRIQHGDWFGGKGVGLCRIEWLGLKINVYTSHLHAEYNRQCDDYLAHRVCQAFEFSQFVTLTSEHSDVNIVAGDFNTEPCDLPYKIICCKTGLFDSFMECEKEETEGGTNERPGNTYTNKSLLKQYPYGKRIDYVMYSSNPTTTVKCLSCGTPLDKCPEKTFSFSDHEAVVAELQINKSALARDIEKPVECTEALEEAYSILMAYLKKLNWDRIFYFTIFSILFCAVFGSITLSLPYGLQVIVWFLQLIFSLLMAFCILMGVIWNRIEQKSILAVQKSLELQLRNLKGSDYDYADDKKETEEYKD